MFYIIIFKDLLQKHVICVFKYRFMKDLILDSGGLISYNTIRQKPDKKYVTKQNRYIVVKC